MRVLFTALVLTLLCVQASVADDSSAPQMYYVKQSSPPLGSRLRRDIIEAGPIPLTKDYSELSAAELALLKSQYPQLAAGDEPPFPINGLATLYNQFRKVYEAADMGYRGDLSVSVLVDKTGKPTEARVLGSPDGELASKAQYILLLQQFKPAVCAGAPCEMAYEFHARFMGTDTQQLNSSNPATGILTKP